MKQREPYEAQAKADKQRYEDEKASYNVSKIFAYDGMHVNTEADLPATQADAEEEDEE